MIARYLPHGSTTPQHMLLKLLENPCLIFDATKRYAAFFTHINMMTSSPVGTELDCLYRDVQLLLFGNI